MGLVSPFDIPGFEDEREGKEDILANVRVLQVRIHFSHLSMTYICHARLSLTPRRPQPVHQG